MDASLPGFFEPGVLKTRAYHAVSYADFSPNTNQDPYILLSIKGNTEGGHKKMGKRYTEGSHGQGKGEEK